MSSEHSTGNSANSTPLAELIHRHNKEIEELYSHRSTESSDTTAAPKGILYDLLHPSRQHELYVMKMERKCIEEEFKRSEAVEPLVDANNSAVQQQDSGPYSDVVATSSTSQAEKSEGGSSWGSLHSLRGNVVMFVHSRNVQITLLLLLVMDVAIVIAELMIESNDHCQMHVAHFGNCSSSHHGGHTHQRLFSMQEHEEHHDSHMMYPIENESGFFPPPGCGVIAKKHLAHSLHIAEEILLWSSRIILMVFSLEILTLLVCLGRHFFTIFYTLDMIIVFVSLALSFTLRSADEKEVAIIIFLRLWRFARVLHGFGMSVHQVEHKDGHSHGHDGHGNGHGKDEHELQEDKNNASSHQENKEQSHVNYVDTSGWEADACEVERLHLRQREELLRYATHVEKERDHYRALWEKQQQQKQ